MDNYPNIVGIILPSFRFKVFTLRRFLSNAHLIGQAFIRADIIDIYFDIY
jgi:hypothetical protein